MIDRLADRALNRTVGRPLPAVRAEVAAFHASIPVVDLLVGTLLFRRSIDRELRHGHVDLPRARAGGLDLAGFTIATRFPDERGLLSAPHFAALGIAPWGRRPIDLVEAFVRRLEGWAAASGGRLVLARSPRGPGRRRPRRRAAGLHRRAGRPGGRRRPAQRGAPARAGGAHAGAGARDGLGPGRLRVRERRRRPDRVRARGDRRVRGAGHPGRPGARLAGHDPRGGPAAAPAVPRQPHRLHRRRRREPAAGAATARRRATSRMRRLAWWPRRAASSA